VRLTRVMLVLGGLFYVFLWVLAANGVSSLVAPLIIPVVLALLVYLGLALNKFLGITPRSQHFDDPEDDDTT
jgi:hypothetical protein